MTALLNSALILLIIVIVAVMCSIVGAWHFNAEADAVLRSDLNASPMIEITNTVGIEEYRRGQTAPILNPGKPILPCPECKDWSGQWINGRFVIKHNGRDVTREVVGSEAEMFSRTPPERR